ncbi:MAG: FAD-dependent oxidoreductase [Candidatus Latescibacterota bacterium]
MAGASPRILVVGGGTGGVAAALAATALGHRVILTEETDWIGGQLTSQAVPPDEHPWIEQFGCTARYRRFRDLVRGYYRDHYPLTAAARSTAWLNPGGGGVSRLCHEPRVALAVLEQMLAWPMASGRLEVRLRRRPVAASTDGDRIREVELLNLETGVRESLTADLFLDATELGDLLFLAGVEHLSGAESQARTGEPHAVPGEAQPRNLQSLTWCFAMGYEPGADHRTDPPAQYRRWRDYVPALRPAWPGRLLDWTYTHPITLEPITRVLFPEEAPTEPHRALWLYRRLICRDHFAGDAAPHEVTLVNWPQNDYLEGVPYGSDPAAVERCLEESRQLSLSLFHWLQTEAPRADGGAGYPGLYLRPDVTGTADGLAKAPYIRESRRVCARFTVTENHVGRLARGSDRAEPFADSIGVGCYRIDLHPSTGGDNYIDVSSLPFQIPLGALVPVRVENLLPAAKNLGTTHVSNGCFRLHPVEWNVGESAGSLAAFCLGRGCTPQQVHESRVLTEEFQRLLRAQGVELEWPAVHPV